MKDWCSYSPDYIFGKYIGCCCERHDYDYRMLYGEENNKVNREKRKVSDIRLRSCIIKKSGSKFVAYMYYFMCRIFGRFDLWK